MQQGMLSSPPQQQPQAGGYNGVVDVQGQKVQVSGGIAEYDGERYFVSDNGEIVMDKARKPLGYVEDGVFKPLDQNTFSYSVKRGI